MTERDRLQRAVWMIADTLRKGFGAPPRKVRKKVLAAMRRFLRGEVEPDQMTMRSAAGEKYLTAEGVFAAVGVAHEVRPGDMHAEERWEQWAGQALSHWERGVPR